MSALPGLIGLLFFIYIRPHEFFLELQDFNFLYLFLGMCAVGILHDISERRTIVMSTPLTPWVFALIGWCIFTLAIRKASDLPTQGTRALVDLSLFLVIAHGIQQRQGFFRVVMTIFTLGLFVAYVGADQGLGPFECLMVIPNDKNNRGDPDGRTCEMKEEDGAPRDGLLIDCIEQGGRPGIKYTCEKVGLFGTNSIGGGRVRFIGVLNDPNDLALATSIATPFAFAFLEIKPSVFRLALLLFALTCVALCVVFTGSRGGVLTFGAVLGSYFVKKYGWKRGFLVGAAMAIPMVVMGGRSDENADASTLERLGCAAAAIKMLMSYPFTGVGYSLFFDHHNLTAHNAYLLAAGEMGAPGMWCFFFLIYLSIKIPLTVLRYDMPESYEAREMKALAMAMLAAFAGIASGIFFLSWTYHFVLWLHFGLAGALYSVAKRRYWDYRCEFKWKERGYVMAGFVLFLIVWTIYIKRKGAWD